MRYLEFAVASNFSFLRGASHPEELMMQATRIGLAGIGLCDRNSVAGVVRAHVAKREHGLPLRFHPGARLVFADGTPDILAYPRDRAGWGRLTRLLTVGNLRAEKGECILYLDDLIAHVFGLELVVMETSSFPSPRLRGEGDEARSAEPGEGLFRKTYKRAPHPTSLREVDLSPQAGRGENKSWGRERSVPRGALQRLKHLRAAAPGRVRLAAAMHYRGRDRA